VVFRCRIAAVASLMMLLTACMDKGSSIKQPVGLGLATTRQYASLFHPKDAVHVGSATEKLWVQDSFEVSRRPFEFAIGLDQLSGARAEGWLVCQPFDSKWIGYYDGRMEASRYMQQRAYVLHGNGTLITLISQYYGDDENTLARQLRTAEPVTQHLVVLAQPADAYAAEEAAESLGLSCDQTAPLH